MTPDEASLLWEVTHPPAAGDNFLKGIDPTKLLVVDAEQIAPLLAVQYDALIKRMEELHQAACDWMNEHRDPATGKLLITADAVTNEASDLVQQLRSFAAEGTGEADEARRKVTDPLYRGKQVADAWFRNLRDQAMVVILAITNAQNDWLNAKRKAQIKERERAAQEAAAAAARALMEATAKRTEEAADAALEAEVAAFEASEAAATPTADLTRTRSVLGVTTSQAEVWTYRVTDIRELCMAVCNGEAPETFIQANDAAIKLAIKGPRGRRNIPGVEVYPEYTVRRRGAK